MGQEEVETEKQRTQSRTRSERSRDYRAKERRLFDEKQDTRVSGGGSKESED